MRVVAAAVALLAAACGNSEPTVIDGSSPDQFEATAAQARRDLPDADRLQFDRALKNPPGRRYGLTDAEVERLVRQSYNGKTAREVLDAGR